MSEDLETRAQDATERFLEDESLTEDLTDTQAKPLITWLTQEAQRIALDASISDEEVSAALKQLRSAVKLSCKNVPEDLLAEALLEKIQHHLSPSPKAPPTYPKDNTPTEESARTIEREDHQESQPQNNSEEYTMATIEALKKLTQSDPTNAASWLKLGDAYLMQGDPKKSAEAQLEAAKLYEASHPLKALQILKVIVSIDPTRTDCQERLARLQSRTEEGK